MEEIVPGWQRPPKTNEVGKELDKLEKDLRRLSPQDIRAADALQNLRAARAKLTEAVINEPVPRGREIFWDPVWAKPDY